MSFSAAGTRDTLRPLSPPLVSIVTPSYNQAEFLEETIQSVLAQDYQPIEYIVLDGGSTDGSVDIIRTYSDRIAWWRSEPDRGQVDALNAGFESASGEILGWLCSDDALLPGAVSCLVAELERHPEALIAYGHAVCSHARVGAANAYRRAAWTSYHAGDAGRARRLALRSLVASPWMSRRTAAFVARTLIPRRLLGWRGG